MGVVELILAYNIPVMITARAITAVAVGGALGSSGRYIVTALMTRWLPNWPAGTVVVNITGSLLLGFLATIALSSNVFSYDLRLAILTGFLGGFTTFSTYMFETVSAVLDHHYPIAMTSFFGQLIVGFFACFGGIVAARALLRG